jgi:aminopeptidase YwaD
MLSALARRAAYASVAAILFGCHAAHVTPEAPSASAASDTGRIRADIVYLASDALEGRGTGTPGNDSAAAYLAREYTRLGLTKLERPTSCPEMRAGVRECVVGRASYLQRFSAHSVAAAHAGLPGELPTQNVIAMQPGTDSALRGEYLVVGAHFDHLGRSPANAMDPDAKDAIRHGADDNASGTAAVLELARRFHAKPARRPIIFVNFSGEELGVLGSEHFVENPPVPLDSIGAMLNFDMVGRLRNDKLIVYGIATAAELPGIVDSANSVQPPLSITALGDGFGPSDHASFYAKKIPVLQFFTDMHEDYHRATDVSSKINVPGEARVIDYAERVARAIADRDAKLTYLRSTQPPPRMAGGPGNGTYFGSVPDMGSDVVGVKLAGVTGGSPADKAGVQAGDIIVEFGGKTVKNIYDYTDAIGAHKPGDVVQVIVLRAGTRHALFATLGKRGS